MQPLSRRDFLLASASLLLAAGPAAALTIEENAPRERRYLAACEARGTHDALVDKLVAELEAGKTVTPETHAATVEQVKAQPCPICGCGLGSIQPYPATF